MGNSRVVLFLAYKSIVKGNKWTQFFIILVIVLSFVNLVFMPSVLSGVTKNINEQVVGNICGNIVVDPVEDEYYLDHVSQIENKIEQVPGVVGVSAHLNNSAFIEYQWREKDSPSDRGKSGTWSVIGIDPEKEANVTKIHEHIIQGSYLDADDRDEIVLGVEIAGGGSAQTSSFLTLDGAQVGDKVRLTYPNGIQREYRVKGIFQARETMIADQQAFVTRKEMASVLGRTIFADRASQVLVRIENTGDESWFIEELETAGVNGEIRSWLEYGGAHLEIASSFDTINSLTSATALMVAAIVMFIIIYINVINKKRQFGILRAVGIKGSIIIHSYLAQTLFYVISGIILGGLVIYFLLEPYFIQHPLDLPMGLVSLAIQPSTVQSSILGLVLATALAGLVPVLLITRQSIINAIWGA